MHPLCDFIITFATFNPSKSVTRFGQTPAVVVHRVSTGLALSRGTGGTSCVVGSKVKPTGGSIWTKGHLVGSYGNLLFPPEMYLGPLYRTVLSHLLSAKEFGADGTT